MTPSAASPLTGEIGARAKRYCPAHFLEVPGVASLTAGKLIGEIAGTARFKTDAQLAHFAGCAPIPASSGRTERWRFDRHGNRQLNAAFCRIALTQARIHPGARACLAKKRAEGKSSAEALRCLKRLQVRVVWPALRGAGEPLRSAALPAISTAISPCAGKGARKSDLSDTLGT